ncbi:DUF3685 domain-containing protein [Roseofilum capinflatum]|uniref:DUF3685 domain-containing protein n=1 Tax=Roseofilum capinflatum BLCC-M114 TaxID=3022440 RepID=A0ABT7B8V5_9CYAN|nr:DUF3685 domain-containing protein [Roseofilum capinflatum]MDJ1174936.1 DUF3685 domain-containing protein [Roseofilum capinflatum BLCC-M114]
MSHSQPFPIRLLFIVPSRIFRLGLQATVQAYPELEIMAEVDTPSAALRYLQDQRLSISDRPPGVGIIVIDSALEASLSKDALLQFCQNLKTWYPSYKLVLLSDPGTVSWQRAHAVGVDGYCPKTADQSQLVATLKQVALGESYQVSVAPSWVESDRPSWWTRVKHRWYLWGIKTISEVETKLKAQLNQPDLSLLERAVIRGRLRELLTARWCIHWLLAPQLETVEFEETRANPANPNSERSANPSLVPSPPPILDLESSESLIPISPLQQVLENTAAHLQFQLNNLTHTPLELDILKPQKRQELLQVVLEEWEVLLQDLKISQIQGEQLVAKKIDLLRDLWSASVTEFFGKYSRIRVKGKEVEIVPIVLQDIDRIQTEYLEKIPLFMDLLNYLVYESPLMIDNRLYAPGTPEARKRAEMLTQNLIVQLGNSVVNPLLNHFADFVEVKQIFYDEQLITSRKIERFRNDLSWRSRQQQWLGEPKAIFESQYSLFILEGRGIEKVSIYAPRREELDGLKGWSLVVTLVLEGRDAVAPRLQALVGSVGQVLIYILTHVIGRGIGLVARGVLQGIGNSWSESRLSGNGDRPK